MKTRKRLMCITCLLSFVGVVCLYPSLPDKIPVHFNYRWEVDQYGPKYSALLLGILPTVFYLLMELFYTKDNRHEKNHVKVQSIIVYLLITFNWITLLIAKNESFRPRRLLLFFFGIMFLLLGNYMPKIRANYLVGIRTPWTLKSAVVWRRCHRIGGYLFVIYGFLCLSGSVCEKPRIDYVLMEVLIIMCIFLTMYSYILYQKESRKN